MAAQGGTNQGLVDLAKQLDPSGEAADVAMILSEATPLVEDLPQLASNMMTAHRSTVQTGKPTTSRRRVNEPGSSSKGTTAQVVDGMTIYETRSTVDKLLVDLAPTMSAKAAVRRNAARFHLQSLMETVEEDFWYGSVADDDLKFNGLTVRYDAISGGATANNIISAGGSADNTSIWLLGFSPFTLHGIYPQGSMAGIMHHDDGLRDRTDPTSSTAVGGGALLSYRDIWGMHTGLAVPDWRFAVRICNIDSGDLESLATTQEVTAHGTQIIEMMGRALDLIPSRSGVQLRFYMGRSTKIGMNAMARAMAYSNIWQPVQINGTNVEGFMGVGIRISDKIVYDEDTVS